MDKNCFSDKNHWDSMGITEIYIAYWELKKLLELEHFKNYVGKTIADFFEGYLFLTEITILRLIAQIERNLGDDHLSEMVACGNKTLQDQPIQNLKNENPNFHLLFLLNKHRKQLARIRAGQSINEAQIKSEFEYIGQLMIEVKSQFFENAERIPKNTEYEKYLIASRLMINQNYIDGHPQGIFYYTAPKRTKQDYSVSNPRNKKKEILRGYSYGLAYLYNALGTPTDIQEKIKKAKTWLQLHLTWPKVNDEFVKPAETNGDFLTYPLFKAPNQPKKAKSMESEIENKNDLFKLFRGRNLRAFELENNYWRTQRIFMDLFLGKLYSSTSESKLELIELTESAGQCTYAIYSGLGGLFWDASEWYIFYQLCPAETSNYRSDFQVQLRHLIDRLKESIDFKRVSVPSDILSDFICEHDPLIKNERREDAKVSSLYGLFAELLAFEYFSKKNKDSIVKWRVKSKSFGNTDLDIVTMNRKRLDVVQVKMSTEMFDSLSVRKHFEAIEKGLPEFIRSNGLPANVKIAKTVFFAKRDYGFRTVMDECKKIGAEPVFEKNLSDYDTETRKKLGIVLDWIENIDKLESGRIRMKSMGVSQYL